MVLDCELYEGVYNMFDVMYYSDENNTVLPTQSVSHQRRMNLVPISLVQKLLPVQKKLFYYEENKLSMLIKANPNPSHFFMTMMVLYLL